ncbi:alkene reductase [Thiofilum flexile]|uniref:alkene reductase n=1 Tax=Thiofilum flexile TaxID=125627 RepID=UPI0003628CDE|nr:alkene reductase [Thiofilum flexile]
MKLLEPMRLGELSLANRAIMAPLTRSRAGLEHVPNALMAEYYAQRASAGLIITECTMILPNTSAFIAEPGIYTEEQMQAWKQVTQAVHAKNGKIFLQIWHAGRSAHPDMCNGQQPISASAIAIEGETHTPKGKSAYVVPRAVSDDEIPGLVQAFAQAARYAKQAGFDGVEIHGANGYLIDQFLRDGSNKRTGNYGGSMENRARFLFEVLKAVSAEIGSERVGLRLSLLNSYGSMIDSDPIGLARFLAERLNSFKLAYLHIMRGDVFGLQKGDVLTPMREIYNGTIIGNMGYSADEAERAIQNGQLDAVAFGTGFLANPDLPERIRTQAPWNAPNPQTFYTPGATGYTDYPFMS